MSDPLYFTQKGLEKIDQEITQLDKRLKGLNRDRSNGDGQIHENASDEGLIIDARAAAWRLGQLCRFREQAILVDAPVSANKVAIGTKVNIRIDNHPEVEWQIAGYGESNSDEHIIAYNTPLAEAIMGESRETFLTRVLAGREVDIEIIKISLAQA